MIVRILISLCILLPQAPVYARGSALSQAQHLAGRLEVVPLNAAGVPLLGLPVLVATENQDAAFQRYTQHLETIASEAFKSVVVVYANTQDMNVLTSGFIIHPEGLIVTEAAVVEHIGVGGAIRVLLDDAYYTDYVDEGDGGKIEYGKVAAINYARNLAFIWLNENSPRSRNGSWPHLELAASSNLKLGDPVVGIGYQSDKPTSSVGRVSAVDRVGVDREESSRLVGNFVQTTVTMNPGSEGGPLLNTDGEVVGINLHFTSPTRSAAGISFALMVEDLHSVIAQYKDSGAIDSAWSAIILEDSETPPGAKIKVILNPVALQAGFLVGDLVVEVNGVALPQGFEAASAAFRYAIQTQKPGDTAQIKVRRGTGPSATEIEGEIPLVSAPPPSILNLLLEELENGEPETP